MRRRKFLQLMAGAVAVASARAAWAQSYSARSIQLIVGFPAGGQVDIIARVTAQWLSQQLGQSVVVENRPGAGGALGAEAVVNAAPDGYTLFFAAASNTVNASLMKNLSYDFVRDTVPVAPINRINLVLEANPSFPATNVAELIAQAKANPGKINIASPSLGTPPYMAVELLKMVAGIDIVHVPYAGEGQMVTDLLGGQLQVAIGGISSGIGHIRDGKLRALALTASMNCPVCRPSARHCPASRRAALAASSRRKARPRRPSAGSTMRFAPCKPMPNSRSGLPISVSASWPFRPPSSARSLPTKPRSGPRWSNSRGSSRNNT
jgi:tripartite-type tricarboxylate transporter receptor subunit TctC